MCCIAILTLHFVTSDGLDFVAPEGLVSKEATRVNYINPHHLLAFML